ncbi:MAG: putative glycolipid-binding domain-containing protein [Thermomicrobiales bacterium]
MTLPDPTLELDDPLRTVLWQRLDLPGSEWCALGEEPGGLRCVGKVLTSVEGVPAVIRYELALDAGWHTREVRIAMHTGTTPAPRRLHLIVSPEQEWRIVCDPAVIGIDPSAEAAAIQGLVDVDLGFSPLTNTLPIRRLAPAVGESVDVTAAWVRFPELTLEPLPQRYTRLAPRRYRYESNGGAFVATLSVDDLGLVTTYEGGWQRLAEASRERG